MRLFHKFLLLLSLAFVLPAAVLAFSARIAASRVADRALAEGVGALRAAEQARLLQLARHNAQQLDRFLGLHEADVSALARLYERLAAGEAVTALPPRADLYPERARLDLPGYGTVDPASGAYADFDRRGTACPWLPRRVVARTAGDPAFRARIVEELDRAVAMTPFLADAVARRPGAIDLAWIVLADGPTNVQPPYDYRSILASDPGIPDLDESGQDYVHIPGPEHNPERAIRWLDPYLDPFKGIWMTSCVAPLYQGDVFLGTTGLDILLPTITAETIDLEARNDGYAFLLSASGGLIAVSREGIADLALDEDHREALLRLYTPTGTHRWTPAQEAALASASLERSPSEGIRALQAAMRAGRLGATEIDLAGSPKLVSYAPVTRTGWSLGVVVPSAAVDAAAAGIERSIREGTAGVVRQFLLFVVALVFGSVAIGVMAHRNVAAPLVGLSDRVGALSWERLVYEPSDTDRRDEIGLLDRRFGEAVRLIRGARDEQVRQRRELQEVNERLLASNLDLGVQIEERQQAQAALRREMEVLSVTLRSIGDGVLVTDDAGRVRLMNPVAEQLTGWQEGQALGKPVAQVFVVESEETGLAVVDPASRILRRGAPAPGGHLRVVARDGALRGITESAAPILSPNGAILGVILVFRDVTGQRRLEAEVARIQALETVEVLAAGIAHDFNNLLSVVQGSLSLLEADLGAQPEAAVRLERAGKAVTRARDLTGQLLTFSTGGEPIRRVIALEPVLRDAAGFGLRGASVGVRFEVAPDLWAVDADAGQISQVVQNLVINAVQAMAEGGTITVAAVNYALPPGDDLPLPVGSYVRVSVRDQGSGIAESLLGRIFDPFFSTKPHGSGLGLAVCHSVLRKHGGHIAVESRVGAGSVFEFWLPALPDAVIAAAGPALDPCPGRGRILLMDDDEAIRAVAADMLATLGYEVDSVGDGEAAIARCEVQAAAGRPYDLLILDLTVPGGMGGMAVVARLVDRIPGFKAIVSSGYSHDPVLADPGAHGFAGMVRKPYGLRELSVEIARVLGRG